MRSIFVAIACAFFIAGVPRLALSSPAQDDEKKKPADVSVDHKAVLGQAKSLIDRGQRWLRDHQNPDGGYGPYGEKYVRIKNTSDVGITSFVLYALARGPRAYKYVDGPFISGAVDFLLARQQPDGAFYDPQDPSLPNYKTSVTGLALLTLHRSKYSDAIVRAREYVKGLQFSEANGYQREKHVSYGGYGYGSGLRADLSNTQFALEFLGESGISGTDELWARSESFLRLCLNRPEVDPRLLEYGFGTTGDGGARYSPTTTRGPVETLDDGRQGFSSYGSMSYAALKSFLYAQVDRNDPDLRALYRWLSRNWSIEENPGMATEMNPRAGLHGLFYYYHTLSKALRLYGEPTLTDERGVRHHWASELVSHLASLQRPDGSWTNQSDRWGESLPALSTAYAVVTLAECMDAISEEQKRR